MALRKILIKGDETLTKKSRIVNEFNDRLFTLLDDMKETMEDANGLGLAAPQVGVLRRVVIVVDDEMDKTIELINPVLLESSGEVNDVEGCLSVPGVFGYVKRPRYAVVRAQDRHGNYFEVRGEGMTARAMCHEIEHLDGELFDDKVTEFVDNGE